MATSRAAYYVPGLARALRQRDEARRKLAEVMAPRDEDLRQRDEARRIAAFAYWSNPDRDSLPKLPFEQYSNGADVLRAQWKDIRPIHQANVARLCLYACYVPEATIAPHAIHALSLIHI